MFTMVNVQRVDSQQMRWHCGATLRRAQATPMNADAKKSFTATKFRIAVVGLIESQAAHIAREFPDLDIRFIMTSLATELRERVKSMDRVIVMTKFVSHPIYYTLDKAKLTHCNGGMSALREILNSLNVFAGFAALRFPALNEDCDMSGLFDFKAFKIAKAGDVLTFVRPDGMEAHRFQQAMDQSRHFYKKQHGILSECKISGGRALITILGDKKPTPVLDAAESALIEEAPREVVPAPMLAPLWIEFYKHSFSLLPYAPAAIHAKAATDAFNGWLVLFGGEAK